MGRFRCSFVAIFRWYALHSFPKHFYLLPIHSSRLMPHAHFLDIYKQGRKTHLQWLIHHLQFSLSFLKEPIGLKILLKFSLLANIFWPAWDSLDLLWCCLICLYLLSAQKFHLSLFHCRWMIYVLELPPNFRIRIYSL